MLAEAHVVTRAQEQAIRETMRLFIEDDLHRGVSPFKRAYCHACGGFRPAAGAISYGSAGLCNPCSIGFELARLNRTVDTIEQYLHRLPQPPPAAYSS